MEKWLAVLSFFSFFIGTSQEKKSIIEIVDEIYPKVHNLKFVNHNPNSISTVDFEGLSKKKRQEFNNYLGFIKKIEKEKKLKGSISFGFTGNEVDNSNLFIIQTGMEASYGVYPLEINATTNIQTQVSDGKFDENLSNLDISMDYHPFEDLTSEAYAFIKRTKNKFLGINQRYEIGGGYIINLFSGKYNKNTKKVKGMTDKGEKLLKSVQDWEQKYSEKKLKELKFKECLVKYCKEKKILDSIEVDRIFNVKKDHEKVIRKLHSKHRVAFLFGLNYEIERVQDSLKLYNKDANPIFKNNFAPTTVFRLVLAPKYELTGDRFKWENIIYFKTGIFKTVDDIYTNETSLPNPTPNNILIDKRLDYWIDFKTEFEFSFAKKLSLTTSLNYIYDNAPKRQYYNDESGIFNIAKAEHKFIGINFNLKYKF